MRRLLLNIPHSSIEGVSQAGWRSFPQLFESVKRWTDWHTDVIFSPNQNAHIDVVRHNLSRFVVDVERLLDDPLERVGRGIVYREFDGIKRDVSSEEFSRYMNIYHNYLSQLKSKITQDTILIDCHSFPSDYIEDKIDICIGYNEDWSKPSKDVVNTVVSNFQDMGYKVGVNYPYSNSIAPESECEYPAFMIELNKRLYMDEQTLRLRPDCYKVYHAINRLYNKLLDS